MYCIHSARKTLLLGSAAVGDQIDAFRALVEFVPVRRQEIVRCLVHQHGYLELHTLADWKPK